MPSAVEQIDFDRLPPYGARRFVPEQASLYDKEKVLALYEQLLARPVETREKFERWILDRSELDAAVSQAGDVLYVKMTCHTDQDRYAGAYRDFIQSIPPAVKPLEHLLNKKYLDLWEQFPLDDTRYEVYNRSVRTEVRLYREDNVALETEVALLCQEYQAVCGAMTVVFDGQEYTLPQMSKKQQEPDRELRERAWRSVAQRRLKDAPRLEALFEKMCGLRGRIAAQAGFPNFRDYQFHAYQRFDYTPEDCKRYHQTVEEFVVPLLRRTDERRCKEMGLSRLRPWDRQADPLGRPPLKPFKRVDELIDGTRKIFSRVDPDLGETFAVMARAGLLDLDSRKGKAPGGYQNTLDETRQPFIFMNAVGLDYDVRTLLHEGGHAFHAFLCAGDPLVRYRHAPMEFSEVASMSMELLGGEHLRVFYNAGDGVRSRREHLEGIVHVLAWVANIDAFQHWMYEHPEHTREERTAVWLETHRRFGSPLVDWSGLEPELAALWHRQLHIFEVPFYYIEYGIAQLGALELWRQARADHTAAIAQYKRALALGGSRPLPALFAAAGLHFDFSRRTMEPLMELLRRELEI